MQGHIHKRVRTCRNGRKSTLWYVVVDLPRGAERERRQKWHGGFQTKKAAEAVRARLIHELTTGFYVEPSRMLLSEWLVDHWLPVHKTRVKKTTYRAYRSAIIHHVNPSLGGVAIGKLTAQMLNGLYQELLADGRCDGEGGLAPATVANIHVVLRQALADAEDAGLIPRNPADKAKPPRPKSQGGELRYWTPGELCEFLGLVEGHRLEAAFHLLAMTGARRGEVAGLRWVDVDFDGARITIRQALLNGDGEVYVSSPKSYRGRTVDLDKATVDKLREHRDRQLLEKAARRRWEDSGFVFTREDGSALNPARLTRAFRWIVDRSELPRIRLHDLRHTHASIAVKAGVPIGVVSERLGHASPEFTLHRYSHVMPGMQREATDTIARAVRLDGVERAAP
jgi:integrase